MPKYTYQGLDAAGRPASGTVEAATLSEASHQVAEMDVLQAEVHRAGETAPPRRGRVRVEDLVAFNTQLAAMARVGIPMDRALLELSRQMRSGRLKAIIEQVAAEVAAGTPLAEALERHEAALPETYVELVRSGIEAGNMPELLLLVNQRLTIEQEFRRQLIDAFSYPLLVLALAVIVSGVVMTSLAPLFRAFMENLESDWNWDQPRVSVAYVWVAERVPEIALALAVIAAVFVLVNLLLAGSSRYRWWRQRALGWVPLYRHVWRATTSGQLCATLSLLLRMGLTMPHALRLSARVTPSERLRRSLIELRDDVESGNALSKALERRKNMPRLLACSVLVAEARGDLPEVLEGAAEMYRRQGRRALETTRVVLPLLAMAIAGAVVGFSALGVILPIADAIGVFHTFR